MSTPINPDNEHHDPSDELGERHIKPVGPPSRTPPRQERVVAGTGRRDTGDVEQFDRESVLARERDGFGGMKFGAAFFGWLAATGLAVIVIAILAGAGVAFGLANQNAVDSASSDTGTAKTVGLVGAIILLVVLLVAYYCGGYVAGRMARFNGAQQGIAVWIWAIVTTLIVALVGWIAGSKFNIFAQLNLPRIPVDEGTVTAAGWIAVGAALVAALVGAVLGGKAGTHYHRKIDRAGFTTTTES